MDVEPLPRGTGRQFEDKVVGMSIPRNYIPAIEKASTSRPGRRPGSFPGHRRQVAVVDGSYHPVDSSEICFKIAGAGALRKGLTTASRFCSNRW